MELVSSSMRLMVLAVVVVVMVAGQHAGEGGAAEAGLAKTGAGAGRAVRSHAPVVHVAVRHVAMGWHHDDQYHSGGGMTQQDPDYRISVQLDTSQVAAGSMDHLESAHSWALRCMPHAAAATGDFEQLAVSGAAAVDRRPDGSVQLEFAIGGSQHPPAWLLRAGDAGGERASCRVHADGMPTQAAFALSEHAAAAGREDARRRSSAAASESRDLRRALLELAPSGGSGGGGGASCLLELQLSWEAGAGSPACPLLSLAAQAALLPRRQGAGASRSIGCSGAHDGAPRTRVLTTAVSLADLASVDANLGSTESRTLFFGLLNLLECGSGNGTGHWLVAESACWDGPRIVGSPSCSAPMPEYIESRLPSPPPPSRPQASPSPSLSPPSSPAAAASISPPSPPSPSPSPPSSPVDSSQAPRPEGPSPPPSPEGTTSPSPEGAASPSPEGTTPPSPEGTTPPSPEGSPIPSPQGSPILSPEESPSPSTADSPPTPSPVNPTSPPEAPPCSTIYTLVLAGSDAVSDVDAMCASFQAALAAAAPAALPPSSTVECRAAATGLYANVTTAPSAGVVSGEEVPAAGQGGGLSGGVSVQALLSALNVTSCGSSLVSFGVRCGGYQMWAPNNCTQAVGEKEPGKGGEGGEEEEPAPLPPVTISGTVFDGSLENCTVFVDANGDSMHTPGVDPSGLQTSTRGWSITADPSQLRGSSLYVEPSFELDNLNSSGLDGCYSTATGLSLAIPLAAPAGSAFITPLTTLVISGPPNVWHEDMERAVIAAFGLKPSTVLGHTDPAGADFQLLVAEYTLASTVTTVASLLAQRPADVPKIAVAVYTSIASIVHTQYVTGRQVRNVRDAMLDSETEPRDGTDVPRVDLTNAATLSVVMLMSQAIAGLSTSQGAYQSVGGGALAISIANAFAQDCVDAQDVARLLRTVIVAQVFVSNLLHQYANRNMTSEVFSQATTPDVIDSEIRRAWLPQPGLHTVKQGEDGAQLAGSVPTAAVIGGAAGAVVLAAMALYAAFVVYARRKRQARASAHLVDGDDSQGASAGGAGGKVGRGRGDALGSFSSIGSCGSTGPTESTDSKHGQYDNPLYQPPRSPPPPAHQQPEQQQPTTPTTPAAAPAQLPDIDEE
ncbi:hypothetical protein FOA52_006799 [Chlamydomonas sp. UWO 241]|nr:hypothetical protein FOA52_006799 [Chlamydomonas sp. UWO 241]